MPGLLELQREFRQALLGGDAAPILRALAEDGIAPELRLDVHRNNLLISLTSALEETFPVICRLVDERFFGYAAHEFIRAHPPERACLHEYGGRFPEFLAQFEPCRDLAYLGDVARLEWLMHQAAYAPDEPPLPPAALGAVPPEQTANLIFRFHPSVALIESRWPIDRIWRANRPGHDGNDAIDLAGGGARLEVGRLGAEVVMRALDAGTFGFRRALHRGARLEDATETALAQDAAFDLTTGFGALFRDAVITGFALAPRPSEEGAS